MLTDMQFAHDGVSDYADVAFHDVRVLASGSAPWRRAARAVLRRGDRPQRSAAAPLPLLDASRLQYGSLALEQIPQRGLQRPWAYPRTCARGCRRGSRSYPQFRCTNFDAVMCHRPRRATHSRHYRHRMCAHPRIWTAVPHRQPRAGSDPTSATCRPHQTHSATSDPGDPLQGKGTILQVTCIVGSSTKRRQSCRRAAGALGGRSSVDL